MKIAIYARVSTVDRQHVENQINTLREYANREFNSPEIWLYVDKLSGSRADRPELKRMLSDGKSGRYQVLLIWALDRLSREGISKMTTYLEQLKSSGIRVISHQETWLDTEGPMSELLVAIFAWMAKQERLRLGERIKAGLVSARKRGKRLGRPLTGIDFSKAERMRSSGSTYREIESETGIPRSTISKHFSNQNKPILNLESEMS